MCGLKSDVQQYRIVLVKSHLANVGLYLFFGVFSVLFSSLPLKDEEQRYRYQTSFHHVRVRRGEIQIQLQGSHV